MVSLFYDEEDNRTHLRAVLRMRRISVKSYNSAWPVVSVQYTLVVLGVS